MAKSRAIIVVWDSKPFWLELIIAKSAVTPYGQVARYYSCMGFEAFLARINNRRKCVDRSTQVMHENDDSCRIRLPRV